MAIEIEKPVHLPPVFDNGGAVLHPRHRRFGAKGDGVTDDTDAMLACLTEAVATGAKVVLGPYVYRMTEGFTMDTARGHLMIEGCSRAGEAADDEMRGGVILLDSEDADSFFYRQTARGRLTLRGLTLRCAQYVLDRGFIKLASTGCTHLFEDMNVESVERPIVYEENCTFQSASLRNVQFRNSGTIHSESSTAVTSSTISFYLLDNVHHEGTTPENSEKIVCNLQGIRQIQGTNFLLEGSLPSTGWTVLKIHNDYDPGWTRRATASFHGYWSEWTGNSPAYAVDQTGGRVTFHDPRLGLTSSIKYKISDGGVVVLDNASFAGSSVAPEELFDIEDYECNVIMQRNSFRLMLPNPSGLARHAITYDQCSLTRDGASPEVASTIFSTDKSSLVWKWDGGYIDGGAAVLSLSSGTTSTPSVDSTYGRKLLIIPNANALNARIEARTRGTIDQYSQFGLAMRLKMPTYTGGNMQVVIVVDGTDDDLVANYGSAYSGETVTIVFPVRVAGTPSTIGIRLRAASATDVSGNMEVYSLAFYSGIGIPKVEHASYPTNVVTWASAAPTAGEWARGDVVRTTTPSAGGTEGWICVADGSPGTWKTFGSIAS